MSGQWELVTKKKDKGSKLPVPKVNHSKENKNSKNILNGVKLEEVLPKSQVQSIYGKNKENKTPDKTKAKEVSKKSQKKEKVPEPQKPKPPKSIESALNSINVEDFKHIYEKVKISYPDAPIVWLKELVQFLNMKIPVENQDPIYSSKPIGYPVNVVPPAFIVILEKVIKDAGKNNVQLFFDICLTTMATDMSKGLPAIGNKIFLQFISLQEPKLITSSIQKHVTLRNSYQNRPNVGLSILWAVSHVGYKDFSSGLLVFRELFLPLLEMKNYSRYVLKYLINLITNNDDQPISIEELLLILDIVYSNKKNMPNDLIKELSVKMLDLKPLLLKNPSSTNQTYVEILLKHLLLNDNKSYKDFLCDILIEIFQKDHLTLSDWSKIYSKNVLASAILLEYINNNWSTTSKKINRSALTTLLQNLNKVNEELYSKKRKEEGLKQCILFVEKIQEKMVAKKKGWFPKKTILLMILGLSGFIFFDIKQQGGWNRSLTKKALEDYKICEYSHAAIDRVKYGFRWSSEKIEEHFPGVQQNIIIFSEPYVELSINIYKVMRNRLIEMKNKVVDKYPIVLHSVEAYVPGLVENSQKAISNVYVTSVLYLNRSVDYLKNEVFVGQFSPENMQRVVIEALNTTQLKATEYYHWIYNKVQTSIK